MFATCPYAQQTDQDAQHACITPANPQVREFCSHHIGQHRPTCPPRPKPTLQIRIHTQPDHKLRNHMTTYYYASRLELQRVQNSMFTSTPGRPQSHKEPTRRSELLDARRSQEIVELLVKHGADVNATDKVRVLHDCQSFMYSRVLTRTAKRSTATTHKESQL